jgi:acetyltransferase
VLTAGISDKGGLRQAMLDAAQPWCLRVIGPNSFGLFVPALGLNASFAHLAPAPGHLAFLSQSGALASAVLDWSVERDIGFSAVVSLGDMADVDVADLLDMLAGERHTRAILLYLESVPDARKFMSAARAAARVKPVIVIKSGRHAAGAQAAATHTGALAGADNVMAAAFRRAGLLRVLELPELFDAAETLSRFRPIPRGRLGIVTNGGGAGVLAVDRHLDFGGELAELAPETIAALDPHLPANWSRANPVDIIGDAGPERYTAAAEAVLADDNVDALLVMSCPTALASPDAAADALIEVVEAGASPMPGPSRC